MKITKRQRSEIFEPLHSADRELSHALTHLMSAPAANPSIGKRRTITTSAGVVMRSKAAIARITDYLLRLSGALDN